MPSRYALDVLNRSDMKLFVAALLASIAATACSSGGDDPAGTSRPPETTALDTSPAPKILPSDQRTVLTASAAVMGEVDFVAFTIERAGAPVFIDSLDVIAFKEAVGRFVAPTSADALVSVEADGFNTQIGAIAFEGKIWLSNPATGKFSLAPGNYAFDPARLFDPAVGFRPLLTKGLTDVEWIGLDTSQGADRYRLKGVADPGRVEIITAGLVRNQEVVLDLWLDVETGEIRELEFDTVNDGEISNWLLAFSEYGKPVEVTPPPTDDGA